MAAVSIGRAMLLVSLVALSALFSISGVPSALARDMGPPPGVRALHEERIPPENLDRWRRMTPEEKDRARERYRRWKELPPEKRERILERRERWRELPEAERNIIRQRRENFRNAPPEEKVVIRKLFRSMKELPPERRRELKGKFSEWRSLPPPERDRQMMQWHYYRDLPREERRVIKKFLLSEPPAGTYPPNRPELREERIPPPGPRPPR